jgi:hypothetical protein
VVASSNSFKSSYPTLFLYKSMYTQPSRCCAFLWLIYPFVEVVASTVVSSERRGVLQGECCAILIEQALNRLISVA